MSRQIEVTLYQFDELSDTAKEKARDWFREAAAHDDWYEFTFEDFGRIAEILGISLDDESIPTHGGGTIRKPKIYFSGFWSQGDGASFFGRYTYKADAVKTIREYAPRDEKLHAIADTLDQIRKFSGVDLSCSIAKIYGGNSVHECTMFVDDVEEREDSEEVSEEVSMKAAAGLQEEFRRLAKWLYRSLEKEYEYQTSAEVVDDNIRANEYEFEADGTRARF